MTDRKIGCLISTIIILLLFTVCYPVISGAAPDAGTDFTDGEITPVLDKSLIRMMVEKATPLIEEITGRRFISEIDYRIISRTALQKLLLKGELEGLRKYMPDMGEFIIKRQAESSAQKKSRFYIGRYFKQSQILYVIPDNIQNAIELYNINDDDLNDFLFIIIAHEMVHAIDNQYYDLSGLLTKTRTSEENMALSAAIGGSAAYVTGIISDRLSISEASLKNSLRLDICMKDESDANDKEVFNLFYIKGEEFLRAVMREKGVREAYDAIFKSPPVLTRQILFPEEYSNPPGSGPVDWTGVLEKISDRLPGKVAHYRISTYGIIDLCSKLAEGGIHKEETDKVAENFINGAMYFAFQEKLLKPGSVNITILNFVNNFAVAEYDEIIMWIQDVREAQTRADPDTALEFFKKEEIKQEGFDSVRFRHFKTSINKYDTTTMEMTGITGGLHLTIVFNNLKDVTQKEMLDILNLIYYEYPKEGSKI